jgi:hypothetical protein
MSAPFMIVVANPLMARVSYHDHGKALGGRGNRAAAG